jgi:hypothetical protein
MHLNFSAEAFGRMIAKISFCAAVNAIGLGTFTNTPIRDVILGEDQRIRSWVGSWWHDRVNTTGRGLHEIRVLLSQPGPYIHAIIRLFAQFQRARIPCHPRTSRPHLHGVERLANNMGRKQPGPALVTLTIRPNAECRSVTMAQL